MTVPLEPHIDAHNVCCGHSGGRLVLEDASFRLDPGVRAGITGPNGMGKSTFLHMLVGLVPMQSGELKMFGRPRQLPQDFVEVRRRVGMLFQDSDDQLFCPTVLEDVAFGPLNLGKSGDEARDIATATLQQLGLDGFEDRIIYKLSGGEKRLVALAGILAMQPEVLLLDEPCAGLDESAEQRITAILQDLPHAMIVVSHHRAFLRAVVHETYRLQDGRFHPHDSDGKEQLATDEHESTQIQERPG